MLRVADRINDRAPLGVPQPDRMAAHLRSDERRDDLCGGGREPVKLCAVEILGNHR